MPLLGKGAMVTWHDAEATGERDFNEWHSKEHLAERVGVPGFLRGYRFATLAGSPKYFILYEVEDFATLTSEPYLDRLNHPTPWTRRSMATFRNNNRTLCRVLASFGQGGIPGFVGTLQLGPAEGRAEHLRRHLIGDLLPGLITRHGLLAAHLLEGDEAASGAATEEKRLRGVPDRTADLAVLLAGYGSGRDPLGPRRPARGSLIVGGGGLADPHRRHLPPAPLPHQGRPARLSYLGPACEAWCFQGRPGAVCLGGPLISREECP